jgi:predicted DNA binding CopG/RHH family protein
MRVNIRWGRDQVNIIKKAAAGLDVPYQLYIKQVVIRQAMIDLKETEQALLAAKS